jgi:hypothetical protein
MSLPHFPYHYLRSTMLIPRRMNIAPLLPLILQEPPMGTNFTDRDSLPLAFLRGSKSMLPSATPLNHFHEILLAAHNLGGIVEALVNLRVVPCSFSRTRWGTRGPGGMSHLRHVSRMRVPVSGRCPTAQQRQVTIGSQSPRSYHSHT